MIISTAVGDQNLGDLALSFKPPKWVRNIVSKVTNSGTVKVSVPTDAGPVEVNRDSVQRAIEALKNARIAVNAGGAPPAPGPIAQAQDFVSSQVPGGWLTVGAVALLGVFMLSRRGR